MQKALADVTAFEERCTAAAGELTAASDALQRAEASFVVVDHAACRARPCR